MCLAHGREGPSPLRWCTTDKQGGVRIRGKGTKRGASREEPGPGRAGGASEATKRVSLAEWLWFDSQFTKDLQVTECRGR